MSACGFCGHTPACGSAEIDGTRYCHGDCPHEDDGLASCYEQAGSMHPVLASLASTWQGRAVIFGLADAGSTDPKETP